MHDVRPRLLATPFPPLARGALTAVQANLGYRCNQSCTHCHVNAGPHRTEVMDAQTIDELVAFLAANPGVATLDLTGGAPELNPHFRRLVAATRVLGRHVIDRCNLTILSEPEGEGLADFLAAQQVEVIASLPCYLEDNVDRQRGRGVFTASLAGLRALNALGYGREPRLPLSLVYNPQGPALPGPQTELEAAYRDQLRERYGIEFTRLLTLANMPIQRFGSQLVSQGGFDAYLATLRTAHRPANLVQVMCRSLVSVDWRGHLYDCDFNQQLGLAIEVEGRPVRLADLGASDFTGLPVRVAGHCYGCTAGQGSSCTGALAKSGLQRAR